MMEQIKQQISNILDQFAREEVGNRLSQFALIALKGMILEAFPKEESKDATSDNTSIVQSDA